MSLLMEALKKAEQAKRKVAEASVVAPSASAPLALEPNPVDVGAAQHAAAAPSSVAPVLTAAAFTLMTGRLAESNPAAASAPAPASIAHLHVEPDARVVAPAAQTPPPMQAAPVKIELSLDKSVRAEPKPLPVARRLPSRRRIPSVWIGVGIALTCTLLGGGFWYYNSMAQYLTQQATLGAPQNALAQAVPPPVAASPVTPPPLVSATAQITPRSAAKVKPVNKPLNAPNAPVVATAPSAASVPAPVVAIPHDVAPADNNAAASIPVPPPAPLNISRDAEHNEIFITLQTAYRAYQGGDDSNAQKLYVQVLGRDDRNRDALLGLAALAVRQKDFVRAQEIYSELLILDPKDSVAQAGFVSVTGSFDPLQQEARIKALLEQEPGASHLLFTYASFLMQQQRWLEATRTLQSALQAQRDNADYAFNLAVSFDHLGQADAAVRYYRAALELAAKQSISFRPDDVRRRLQAMSANGSAGGSP